MEPSWIADLLTPADATVLVPAAAVALILARRLRHCSTSRSTRCLLVLLSVMVAGAMLIDFERVRRLANILAESPALRGRAAMVPNYANVWFAHDIVFINSQSGELCDFGRDLVLKRGSWDVLCWGDSDGDGLTNGQELGDPCCRWNASDASGLFDLASRKEYRRWKLSHPSKPDTFDPDFVKASTPEDCELYDPEAYRKQFRTFYFAKASDEAKKVPWSPLKLACLAGMLVLFARWTVFYGLLSDVFPWASTSLDSVTSVAAARVVVACAAIVAAMPAYGRFAKLVRDVTLAALPAPLSKSQRGSTAERPLTSRESAALFVASFFYMDLTSGIIHLILDYAPFWLPGIGDLARGFQYHHDDPTAIVRISWYAYVSHIHVLVPVIACLTCFSGASRAQRLFWFFGAAFAHLFQTAHRWAHMPSDSLPWGVRSLQSCGLLIDTEAHMRHHEDLYHQFTILSGHTDVVLDGLARVVPPSRYDLWLVIGIAWFFLPAALDMWSQRKRTPMDDLHHSIS